MEATTLKQSWKFINGGGDFTWENPEYANRLYLPLCNEHNIMSSITPSLYGDIKVSNEKFLLTPVSIEDLHSSRSSRNFWIYSEEYGAWSATGNSVRQRSSIYEKQSQRKRTINAGMFWQEVTYEDELMPISASILNFVPVEQNFEVMVVKLKNNGNKALKVTPTSAIPIYARSAENIRDHRHVTSLLNEIEVSPVGIAVRPTLIFNEKKHLINKTTYFVYGFDENGDHATEQCPLLHNFIGDRGTLDWPETIIKNSPFAFSQAELRNGEEYIGALRFGEKIIEPGECVSMILLLGISDEPDKVRRDFSNFNTLEKVTEQLEKTKESWKKKSETISFLGKDKRFHFWMRWVGVQPVLRRIYGNSFLPYHDYGKGGRGWRDLWQDLLFLLISEPKKSRESILNNFRGVRIDGTNATIIGSMGNSFQADRNKISRVWMDHGAWPLMTVDLYINQTGDINILMEEANYFFDHLRKRSKEVIQDGSQDTLLRDQAGNVYSGTILEHLLVQNLTSFFNVGEHNIIKLENGDWNDGIDMAGERGETIAFTAFYAHNLQTLSQLLRCLQSKLGIKEVYLFEELLTLFDSMKEACSYNKSFYKQKVLNAYMESTKLGVSGNKEAVSIDSLIIDLEIKANRVFQFVRETQYNHMDANLGFYNSYYDNRGNLVDSNTENGVMMSLIGQVFTVMTGLATSRQIPQIFNACMKYLRDDRIGTLRLNTRLNSDAQDFGRAIGFAYGHKENGAAFNHMTVMFMNALYRRGFVNEGYQVFKSIYQLCNETQKSQIYPGIPEYFDPDGKGMYPYLTGSASWLMFTMLTEVYGVKGSMGDLKIHPKLVSEQFSSDGEAGVNFSFQGAKIMVNYYNPKFLDYKDYKISEIWLNDLHLDYKVYNSIYKEKELVLNNNEAKPESKWKEILLAQKDLVSSQPEDSSTIKIDIHLDV